MPLREKEEILNTPKKNKHFLHFPLNNCMCYNWTKNYYSYFTICAVGRI